MTFETHRSALIEEEYRALKAEMLLRIAIQNITILGAVGVFTLTTSLMVNAPQQAGTIALLQAVATFALALQWCHQGARQCALKRAILKKDEDAGRKNGWESWLPNQRPAGLLGSRWFISTKAVFICLVIVSILLAMPDYGIALGCAVVVWISIVLALLTNPKE